MTPANPIDWAAKLVELEEKAKAATPGPWKKTRNKCAQVVAVGEPVQVAQCGDYTQKDLARFSGERWNANAAHIAACSPDTIIALIAEFRRVVADAKRMEWLEQQVAGGNADFWDYAGEMRWYRDGTPGRPNYDKRAARSARASIDAAIDALADQAGGSDE